MFRFSVCVFVNQISEFVKMAEVEDLEILKGTTVEYRWDSGVFRMGYK